MGSICVATKNHTLLVFFRTNNISILVQYIFAIFILQRVPFITHVEIQFSIGAKRKSMYPMIMLITANTTEHHFFSVCFIISIIIIQYPYIRALRNDDFVTQYTNAQGRIQFGVLVKYFCGICFSITIIVLQYHNAIA